MMFVQWYILIWMLSQKNWCLIFKDKKLWCSREVLPNQTEKCSFINIGLTLSWQMIHFFEKHDNRVSRGNLQSLSREEGSNWTLMRRKPYADLEEFWLHTPINWILSLSSHSCCRKLRSVRTSKCWTVSKQFTVLYSTQYLTERTTFKLSNTLTGSRPLSLMLYNAFISQPARQQPLQHQ